MNLEKIKAVNPGNYCLYSNEIVELMNETGNVVDAICLSFKYGFTRGQNCERARARKRRKAAKK